MHAYKSKLYLLYVLSMFTTGNYLTSKHVNTLIDVTVSITPYIVKCLGF